MKREEIIQEAETHNNKVGADFAWAIRMHKERYDLGVVDLKEYIRQIATCCEQAKEEIIKID